MKSGLSDSELETYARQIALKDIGCDGQLRLRNSTACVLGLGGLGSKITPQLVGTGIGHMRIVDRDIVSRVDLHRQYLYDTKSIGRPNVEVAFKKLKLLNPDTELIVFPESLNSTNAAEKLKLDAGLGENIEQQERSQSCIFQPRWMVEALNFRRI